MKKTAGIAAMAAVVALTLAGCGDRPDDDTSAGADDTASESASESSSPAESNPDFKACMVSDSGGFDDQSFNQTSLKGMTDAESELGIQTAQVESAGDAEYADNINSLVKDGCNQITSVGFKLGDATLAAAKKNKDIDFSIVDFAYSDDTGKNTAPANLQGLVFDTKSASYLAGYVAASASESGTVGTFGGLPIPSVTDFMDGYIQGVEKYNEDNGADVKVVGWDGKDGQFTEDFEDSSKGKQVGEQLVQQGADVIFPVAGPAGLGGLQAAQDADVKGIWVDTDGCESTDYCDVLLTSVEKGMDVAVDASIHAAVDDSFSNELYVGTLENDGVGLSDLSDDVDPEVADKVEELKQQLISGDITLK